MKIPIRVKQRSADTGTANFVAFNSDPDSGSDSASNKRLKFSGFIFGFEFSSENTYVYYEKKCLENSKF